MTSPETQRHDNKTTPEFIEYTVVSQARPSPPPPCRRRRVWAYQLYFPG